MKLFTVVFASVISVTALHAEEPSNVTFHVWTDLFGGSQGAVVYPQYAWDAKTPIGDFGGYGFVEVAPHEPLFTNHLVIYTPNQTPWFSIHTETGGIPNKGLNFFQIGPRLNVTKILPSLKKPMHHLFVTALPRFEGIRHNNVLVAGATNQMTIMRGLKLSVEGYRRSFAHGYGYGEYWILVHPKATPHLSLGTFIHDDGGHVSVGFGTRISLW